MMIIFLALLSVVLTLYIPILVGAAIDSIVGAGLVDFANIIGLLLRIGIAALFAALFQWLMQIMNNRIAYLVIRDIRNDAFRHIQALPLKYLDAHPHGDILNRIVSDADQFGDGLLMGFTQLFSGVLTIVGTLFFMLSIHPKITLAVVVLTPVSLLVARFIAGRTYDMFHTQSQTQAKQTAFLDEMIGSQKTVQAFSHEKESMEQFDDINNRLEAVSLRALFFSSITNPTTRFINSLVYAIVALGGAFAVIGGSLTVGGLSAFLSYANQYTKPFNEISGVVTELQNALACAARIFELMAEPEQIPDDENASVLAEAEGHIDIEHVNFAYSPGQKLIRDFQLQVSPGQRVAIVGPTGCGKTTMINLLMRFYDVDSGRICVDGSDVREITRGSLRHSFGMVLQETWLREATIRDNIAIGRPDATDDEVIAAAKAAYAHEFILRLPQGYHTIITGEEGGLSQGQRQMLCIARVMICYPPMLILDEATSSIDTRTEVLIQQAFAGLMKGRTSFIVAHRLSTIKEADIILVMKDGNIIEKGNHEDLLAQNGFYTELYNSQFAL